MTSTNTVARWHGVLAMLGIDTVDGRRIHPGAATFANRDLPLPLMSILDQENDTPVGHEGSVLVGQITDLFVLRDDMMTAGFVYGRGTVNDIPPGRYKVGAELYCVDMENGDGQTLIVTKFRLVAATLTPNPAWPGCFVEVEK